MMGHIEPFNRIGIEESKAVQEFLDSGNPLSGYLAGKERGGDNVVRLETAWEDTFHVKHAIACNSATSGLMAAAFAVGLKYGDEFICPAMTMSATAAAPMFTGATPFFGDVDLVDFSLRPSIEFMGGERKAVFLTHLFGGAANEGWWKNYCDRYGMKLIVDASQSPLATIPNEGLAGTIGHIGVFSLNIHKPIQCGEGGMIVTNDDDLAARLRAFINHGEHVSGYIGLNLRMPEISAVIAKVQLRFAQLIIGNRIGQAHDILTAIDRIPGLWSPERVGKHVYYTIPFLIANNRAEFCDALLAEGVPVVEGYVAPLYRMPTFAAYKRSCPIAEDLHDRRLFYIENCAWDFTQPQIRHIGEAFRKAARVLS